MKIVKLQPSQHVSGRWLLWLEDGTLVRVGEGEVASFGLRAGMELSDETWEELTAAAGFAAAREKALSLLSARPLSRKELVDKLTARPAGGRKEPAADEATAQAVADRLEELGYLNDGDYACMVAKHYTAKGYGPAKIRDELYRRGVPRDLWDGALEELEEPEDTAARIDAFLEKRLRGKEPDRETLRKAGAALARRGFRWEDIRDGLCRWGGDPEED